MCLLRIRLASAQASCSKRDGKRNPYRSITQILHEDCVLRRCKCELHDKSWRPCRTARQKTQVLLIAPVRINVPSAHTRLGAPEVADAAVVDVEGAEGRGRQPQRDAQQRAQDGLVRHHQVRAAWRVQHLCAHGSII